jgi:L-2-hydroxyglutarate oxidase LhgO
VTHGQESGVNDLILLDQTELSQIESAIVGVAAVYSPSTGIVDTHGLMVSYLGDAENSGALLALNSPVMSGELTKDGIVLQMDGDEPMEILCDTVVNAAGLYAHLIAALLKGFPNNRVPVELNYYSIEQIDKKCSVRQ